MALFNKNYLTLIILKINIITKPSFIASITIGMQIGYSTKCYSKEKQVVKMVGLRHKTLPRAGVRKLHYHLQNEFVNAELKIGRDRLFNILRANDMLVKLKKYSCRTTNSYHHFHKYNNLIKDFCPTSINQVWVSDITYIRTVNGFCYLALITDLYSRKIVGFDISDSLELKGSLRALKRHYIKLVIQIN